MNNENCDLMSEDNQQMTPLHMAAEQSNVNILKLLLEKYVDCNIGNISGRTPLHFAATVGYEKWVHFEKLIHLKLIYVFFVLLLTTHYSLLIA